MTEVVAASEDAEGVRWRLSIAAVDEDGPFSHYPGIDRVIVVLEGEGMVLDHDGAAASVTVLPGQPYRFSGDWQTRCRLLAGPVRDWNLMVRRGLYEAEVVVRGPGPAVPPEGLVVLHPIRAGLLAGTLRCEHGETLIIDPSEHRPRFQIDGQGVALQVVFRPTSPD